MLLDDRRVIKGLYVFWSGYAVDDSDCHYGHISTVELQ